MRCIQAACCEEDAQDGRREDVGSIAAGEDADLIRFQRFAPCAFCFADEIKDLPHHSLAATVGILELELDPLLYGDLHWIARPCPA